MKLKKDFSYPIFDSIGALPKEEMFKKIAKMNAEKSLANLRKNLDKMKENRV